MFSIRPEGPGDSEGVRAVNQSAFGQADEANIVDRLRESGHSLLSLVATIDDQVVGHIQFSPVSIQPGDTVFHGAGLGPLAVLPDFQGQGIGTALVEAGLSIIDDGTCPFVVVLGHPGYYPRFGFQPASDYDISSQWEDFPEEHFMIVIFDHELKADLSGIVRYGDEFE